MAGCLHSDVTRWPLVLLTAPVQWGAETVARYVEETSRHSASGQRFGLVLDLTCSALLPTSSRSKLVAHRRWLFSHRGTSLICEAVVIRSRAQREFFAMPPDAGLPIQRFCATRAEAVELALTQLKIAGVMLAPDAPQKSGVGFVPRKTSGGPEFYTPGGHVAGRVIGKH